MCRRCRLPVPRRRSGSRLPLDRPVPPPPPSRAGRSTEPRTNETRRFRAPGGESRAITSGSRRSRQARTVAGYWDTLLGARRPVGIVTVASVCKRQAARLRRPGRRNVAREGCSEGFCLPRLELGRVALCAEPDVEGESDDVSVRYASVGVAAADSALELEDFGDGMVELSAFGVPVSDDVQSVRMRFKVDFGIAGQAATARTSMVVRLTHVQQEDGMRASATRCGAQRRSTQADG